MMTTRLMNVLVALLLVAGQLASGVHLASHVTPLPVSVSAYGQGFSGQLAHDHQALEHVAHVHFHAHQLSNAASLHDKPPEKTHNAGDCALCHLASHLLLASYRGSVLPQSLVADKIFVQLAEHAPAQAYASAHAIRGPPRFSLI